MALVKRVESTAKFMIESSQLRGPDLVVFLQEPEGFPHNLARRVIAAGLHFGVDELLQFGCKGNVHEETPSQYASFINEDCQSLSSSIIRPVGGQACRKQCGSSERTAL